jgi:RNA-directed DNA polymerase
MRSKIQEIRQTLRYHRQAPIHEQGTWLGMVIRGFNAYFAVPTNSAALTAFRDKVTIAWMAMLTRRSQRHRLTWPRMKGLADRYLPRPHILHPWPNTRFRVRHSR